MESTLSSLAIRKILPEIREEIKGKYLNKVQQLEEDTYRFRFSPGSSDLIIEPGKRLNITDYRLRAPKKPKQSSMVLRKHLSNSRLEEIKQVGFDRVIEMNFTNGKRVIIELFGEGNLVLTDEEDEIIHVHRRREWKGRKLKRGEKYDYPPSDMKDPFRISFQEFKGALSDNKVVVSLAKDFGLGGDLAEEICKVSGIDKNLKPNDLDEGNLKNIYDSLKEVINREKDPIKQENKIRSFPLGKDIEKHYKSLNEAVDDNYTKEEEEEEKPGRIIKLEKRLESQKNSLKEFKDKSKEYKEKGDKIYENYSEVSKAIQLYKKGKEEELEDLGAKVKDSKIVFDLD